MAAPRQILPGIIYLVSRRCALRQLLLRPDAQINQIFRFCLAHAAERFGVQIHAYCVLSNHYHIVLTDVHGTIPEFMHWLNEYVAKCVNAHRGRWEAFWAPGSYSAVRLTDREDVLGKMVYTYTNPVDAGLVRTAREWPGARSLPEDLAKPPVEVRRPEGFFRENGSVPEIATLRLDTPDVLQGDGADPVRLLERAVDDREQEIQSAARAKGQKFLGPRRVLAQSPFNRPRSGETRRRLNPRIAARDRWRRIEALQRLKAFIAAYREARSRYLEGSRAVRFPLGTYWMRVRLGVLCCEA